MKKLFYALLAVSLLTACSNSNNNKDSKDKDEPLVIEGTVVKIFDVIFPSAYADVAMPDENAELVGNSSEPTSLPLSVIGWDCPADRCAFLIDSGSKIGRDSDLEQRIIAATPVIDGKFRLVLTKEQAIENPIYNGGGNSGQNPMHEGSAVYKVVVRGWDPVNKKPLAKSEDDREIILSAGELRQKNKNVAINPETTVASRRRVEVLKSNFTSQDSFLDILAALLKEADESASHFVKRMLAAILSKEKNQDRALILEIQKIPSSFLNSDVIIPIHQAERFLDSISKYHLNSIESNEDLLIELNKINSLIAALRMGQNNQLARYPYQALNLKLKVFYIKYNAFIELENQLFNTESLSEDFESLIEQYSDKLDELLAFSLPLEKEAYGQMQLSRLHQMINELNDTKSLFNSENARHDEIREELNELLIQVPSVENEIVLENSELISQLRDFNSARSNRENYTTK